MLSVYTRWAEGGCRYCVDVLIALEVVVRAAACRTLNLYHPDLRTLLAEAVEEWRPLER